MVLKNGFEIDIFVLVYMHGTYCIVLEYDIILRLEYIKKYHVDILANDHTTEKNHVIGTYRYHL